MKTKLTFNQKPRYESKSLYHFNNYLNTFEKGNYKLFVISYYKLTANKVKYWRKDPIKN